MFCHLAPLVYKGAVSFRTYVEEFTLMKITAVRRSILESPESSGRANRIVCVPERHIQYTHRGIRLGPARQAFVEVQIVATKGVQAL